MHAGRPAGVGRLEGLLAAATLLVVADDQVPLHDIHLLPVIVHERLGRVRARLDLQEPRAAAAFIHLVEIARQDLLIEARRIALRPLPAGVEVDTDEFEMLLGLHAPSSLPSSQAARNTSSCAIAWCT